LVESQTDIVIVGAGLAGGVMAVALASAGLRCVLVDHQPAPEQLAPEFDGRASAIAQAPKQMLDSLGIWRCVPAEESPILDIRVSDGDSRLFLHYDHEEVGAPALGYMVENRHLRFAIQQAVEESERLQLIAPAEISSIEAGPDDVCVTLAGGERISAHMVIAADGRQSKTRESASIQVTAWDYGQTGFVCTVAHEHPHQNVAHERFLPAGPFAILPLTGNRASIVWTEKEPAAAHIKSLDDDDFMAALARRFGDFLGELELVSPRWAYPLSLQFARTSTADRLALIGDASHAMHPIAGQGLNMGLRDVAALAEVLTDAHRLGLDIGAAHVLAGYERWRGFDNMLMLASTDGLNRLFSNDLPPVRLARDLGLAVVNKIGPLKKTFMRHAMGQSGNLPRLLKGQAL
jgi:2-octaprenyl-6-methoxyphenol hydroxylase